MGGEAAVPGCPRRVVAAALGVLLLASIATAGPEFKAQLKRALALAGDQKWESAEPALLKLLRDHEGDEAVLLDLPRIEDALKLCLFHKTRKKPGASELLGRGAKSFNHGSRKVKYEFTALVRPHWQPVGDAMKVLDARFTGSLTVEYEGALLDTHNRRALAMLVCFDPEKRGGYIVRPGYPDAFGGGYSFPAQEPTIEKLTDGDADDITKSPKPIEILRGSVSLTRRAASFTLKVDKKTVAKANDYTYESGHLAIVGGRPTRLEISGRLDKHYYQSILGEYWAKDFADWESAKYDRRSVLPGWVVAKPEGSDEPPPPLLPPDAIRLADDDRAKYERAVDSLFGGGVHVLVLLDPKLPRGAARTRLFLDAAQSLITGDLAEAERRLKEVVRMHPDFVVGRTLLAITHQRLRRTDEARKELQALADEKCRFHGVYVGLAGMALHERDLDGAARILHKARSLGLESKALDELGTLTLRARSGPQWTQKFEYETEHFQVYSDHSRKVCIETAKLLEKSRKLYAKLIRPIEGKGFRSRVYVFAGQAGYLDYTRDLQMEVPRSAGLYSSTLRELLLWVPSVRTDLWDTVRHEGFHQYLHHFLDDAPIWFNEGHAELAGGTGFESRRRPGAGFAAYKLRVKPVAVLMNLPPVRFMASPADNYAQSDDLVRFLRSEHAGAFEGKLDEYLAALLSGCSQRRAYELVFEPVAPDLDRAFQAWLGN